MTLPPSDTTIEPVSVDPSPSEAPASGGLRAAAASGRAVLETVLLGLLFYFLISQFVLQPFRVEQTSMEPTVEPGEYVLVDKFFAGAAGYHRGDIVILRVDGGFAPDPTAPLIKRIVALAGEHLQIRNGEVLIDGARLAEPYLPTGTSTETGEPIDLVIPSGMVWVMGDHRGASTDSRVFGPVSTNDVIGHALLRYWPLDRFSPLGVDPAD